MMNEPNWLVHARELQAIAQIGLAYTKGKFDAERYNRIRAIAAAIMAWGSGTEFEQVLQLFSQEIGYATLTNVRFGLICGLRSDNSRGPRSATRRHWFTNHLSIVWRKACVNAPIVYGTLPRPDGQQNEDLFVNSHPKSRIIALSAAFAMLGLDQLTKHWALVSFGAVGTTIELVGPFDLTLVLNRSNAFGLIPAYGEFSRWALTALNFAVAVILLRFVLRKSTSG